MALWAAVEGRFTAIWRREGFIRVLYRAGEPRITIWGPPRHRCGLFAKVHNDPNLMLHNRSIVHRI